MAKTNEKTKNRQARVRRSLKKSANGRPGFPCIVHRRTFTRR